MEKIKIKGNEYMEISQEEYYTLEEKDRGLFVGPKLNEMLYFKKVKDLSSIIEEEDVIDFDNLK